MEFHFMFVFKHFFMLSAIFKKKYMQQHNLNNHFLRCHKGRCKHNPLQQEVEFQHFKQRPLTEG